MAVNVELLQKTLDTIKANPEHWKQDSWHRNTSHCFAGFAELIGNDLSIEMNAEEVRAFKLNNRSVLEWSTWINAKRLLGITNDDGDILFYGYNTLELLERMVAHLIEHGSLDEFGDCIVE